MARSIVPRYFLLASMLIGSGVLGIPAGHAQAPAPAQTIGDFSGLWTRGSVAQSFFREPEAGPGPVLNLNPPPSTAGGGAGNPNRGDHTNPILQPWAAELVLRRAKADRAGRPELNSQSVCRPYGLPFILQLNDTVQFLHTPDHFVVLYSREGRPRIIHMNAKHPDDFGSNTYGHSVGHWQGDTLVIDTVGMTDTTWVDNLGTPHTDQLRVVERYRKISEGKIRVDFTVEDPGAFTTPWSAYVVYTQSGGDYFEQPCAENNVNTLTGFEQDIPRDDTPDF
jgi:hypothetical protein